MIKYDCRQADLMCYHHLTGLVGHQVAHREHGIIKL